VIRPIPPHSFDMENNVSERFDMVVIGSGPAGEKAATQAAYFDKRVAIVERASAVGGSAVTHAGIPTKTLRETALYITGFRKRDVYGLSLQIQPDIALERLMTRTAEVVASITDRVHRNIQRHGIELIRGVASLGPDHSVTVREAGGGNRVLEAAVALIASGSRPFHPPGMPVEDPDVHDSEEILEIDRIPQSMVVVGGGPVGCEYASIFTSLGVEVTLVDTAPRLLPFMDGEVSELLAESFAKMGMRLLLDGGRAAVDRDHGYLRVRLESGEVLRPDKVLVAVGRAGNTEGLNLEAAGVKLDARGRIVVDDKFRTTADWVWAAGDVIGAPALASVSMEQGRVAACNAFGIPFKDTVDPLAPYGVYSIPEVAMAGLTEEGAAAAGIDYEVGRGWFAENPRSIIAGSTEGLVKLIFRRENRQLIGVHVLGDYASELIHQGQAVMHEGASIDRFIDATFNFPTRSEMYKYAAYDGLQRLSGKVIR
jgi:NAD(P) transhydrogenase